MRKSACLVFNPNMVDNMLSSLIVIKSTSTEIQKSPTGTQKDMLV